MNAMVDTTNLPAPTGASERKNNFWARLLMKEPEVSKPAEVIETSEDLPLLSTPENPVIEQAEFTKAVEESVSTDIHPAEQEVAMDSTPATSPQILEAEGDPTERAKEWNLVTAPSSEGEPSVVSEEEKEAQTHVPQEEQVMDLDLDGTDLSSSEEDEDSQLEGESPSPISVENFQEFRQQEQEEALKESAKNPDGPMEILRKGAVAALGGTMVVTGLIMIPLPTPFGVVVASSGMAVLGAEFDSARKLNDKITTETKKHWVPFRDKLIHSIEEMEGEGKPTCIGGKEAEQGENEDDVNVDVYDKALAASLEYMNEAERKRQEALAKEREKARQQSSWKRGTGAFLSKTLVPLLRRDKEGSEASSVPDADLTVQSDMETSSEIDQTEVQDAVETTTSGLADPPTETEEEILSQPVVSHVENTTESTIPTQSVAAVECL